jgi:hypothetical protein
MIQDRFAPLLIALNLILGAGQLLAPQPVSAFTPWKTCEVDTKGNAHCCVGCSMVGPDECEDNDDCGKN